jgi:deoxyribonuclease V
MKACVDVDYHGDDAVAACVQFHAWTDKVSVGQHVVHIRGVEEYIPGQFFRRELPCLLAVLGRVTESLELVVVDGYVWLGDDDRPGLGAHLYEALDRRIAVVGVAKTRFAGARSAVEVVRGESATRPLFVTTAGFEVATAARCVSLMHGKHRIPTLMRQVDRLCREANGE